MERKLANVLDVVVVVVVAVVTVINSSTILGYVDGVW